MADPSVVTRVTSLNKALDAAKKLNDTPNSVWTSQCEKVFSEFRTRVVHLRREPACLDAVEDKEQIWQFIVRFCKEMPFHHDRCNEVLRILMKSDAWMEKFNDDDDLVIGDLPEGIADDFEQRAKEVREKEPPTGEEPKPPFEPLPEKPKVVKERKAKPTPWSEDVAQPPVSAPMRPSNMAVVVQRISKARVLIDERNQWWGEVCRGIMISVSFTKGARGEAVGYAARFLMTAKLSTRDTWEPGQQTQRGAMGADAESVINICKEGGDQGILVMPQASLGADLGKDNVSMEYGAQCKMDEAERLYKLFIDALREACAEMLVGQAGAKAPQIVNTPFHGRQYVESTSAQPFLHAFNF